MTSFHIMAILSHPCDPPLDASTRNTSGIPNAFTASSDAHTTQAQRTDNMESELGLIIVFLSRRSRSTTCWTTAAHARSACTKASSVHGPCSEKYRQTPHRPYLRTAILESRTVPACTLDTIHRNGRVLLEAMHAPLTSTPRKRRNRLRGYGMGRIPNPRRNRIGIRCSIPSNKLCTMTL